MEGPFYWDKGAHGSVWEPAIWDVLVLLASHPLLNFTTRKLLLKQSLFFSSPEVRRRLASEAASYGLKSLQDAERASP